MVGRNSGQSDGTPPTAFNLQVAYQQAYLPALVTCATSCLMHMIFQCANRWELTDTNPIELVRVKDGSKCLRPPRILSPQEFCLIPPIIVEPYRTQVWIARCFGLRPIEIMALRWSDFDFNGQAVLTDRGVVHGRVADAKTEYSKERVPLDASLAEILFKHKEGCQFAAEDWVLQFRGQESLITRAQNGRTISERPDLLRTGRRYRLEDISAQLQVMARRHWSTAHRLKELTRHASIQSTMNVYSKPMADSKRQPNSKTVRRMLKGEGPTEAAKFCSCGYWEFTLLWESS